LFTVNIVNMLILQFGIFAFNGGFKSRSFNRSEILHTALSKLSYV
jgi:hypothetical protein